MPFTPQVTNNTPETKILDSTFNELAENDIYLKERADVVDNNQLVRTSDDVEFNKVTTPTADITTETVGTSNITTANIGTANISGAINPTTTPVESAGSTITTAGQTSAVPRGIYQCVEMYINYVAVVVSVSDFTAKFQVKRIDGTWIDLYIFNRRSTTDVTDSLQYTKYECVTSGSEYRVAITTNAENATIQNAYLKYRKL